MTIARRYYGGIDYGDSLIGDFAPRSDAALITNKAVQRAPAPYTGRLNEDVQLGIIIGLTRAALAVEKISLAGEKSTYAQMIRALARHDDMKVETMMKEGKLV